MTRRPGGASVPAWRVSAPSVYPRPGRRNARAAAVLVLLGGAPVFAVGTGAVTAAPAAPTPIEPASLTWVHPPGNPKLKAAWVIGTEGGKGSYVLRVVLGDGGRIPPHTHPDERIVTVLSGTVYVGFGASTDDGAMVEMPAGSVYVVPAGVPHYLAARGSDVTYQEAGIGPTATDPVGSAAHAGEASEQQALGVAAAAAAKQCTTSTPCTYQARRRDGQWYVLVQFTRRASPDADPLPYPGGHELVVVDDAGQVVRIQPGR